MKVKIVHCPTSQNNRAKVTTLVTLIEQRLGIKAVTIPGTTGQFEVTADEQRIAIGIDQLLGKNNPRTHAQRDGLSQGPPAPKERTPKAAIHGLQADAKRIPRMHLL